MFLILFCIFHMTIRSNLLLNRTIIPIQGWITNSDQYCFFDGPGNILVLPTHYAEIVQRHLMTTDVVIVKDGGLCPRVLSEPFFKSPAQVSSISVQFCKELTLQIQPLGWLLELEGMGVQPSHTLDLWR